MIILLSAADILQVCAEAGTIRKGETPLAGRKYGLDLGTMNIRIFQGGHGLVVYEKNMIATVREYDYDEVKERIQKLIDVSYTYDQMKIVAAMKDIVPEFVSKNSCFEALDKKD